MAYDYVGFDTYCQQLMMAIRELQGKKWKKLTPPLLINVTADIPMSRVGVKSKKMIEYKRLADVKNLRELELIKEEWTDRFGKIPESVLILIQVIKIRLLATGIGINFIRETPMGIRIFTEYEQNEWRFISNGLDKKIVKHLKWVKAPASSSEAKSIIILDNSLLGTNELFNMFESLFYGINKIQNTLLSLKVRMKQAFINAVDGF
jgi:transcription-repair coupling factor (superfamily II helicase)